jgi:hypothetical protein
MTKNKNKSISKILGITRQENISNFFELINYLKENEFELFKVAVNNPELVIALCED